jgi:hypothetical protein
MEKCAAEGSSFLQPWFVNKSTYLKFRTMLPSCHLLKLRHYFEDYGCLRCGKVQARYGNNGFCRACGRLVSARMICARKRRFRRLAIPIPPTADREATGRT